MTRRRPVLAALILGSLVLASSLAAPAAAAPAVTPFPATGAADYQLGGAYAPGSDVTIVVRDSTAWPAKGRYNVCYVNGFQTQPSAAAMWRREHPRALLRDAKGKVVADPGWPDEMLLDTRTAAKRSEVVAVLTNAVKRCAARGFDAVEYDNLDSWTRSRGLLTKAGNVALARSLVALAHRYGLAAGQKNTPQLGTAGRTSVGFDFAVAEECHRWDECAAYTRVYGSRVLDVEYADDLRGTWAAVCRSADRPARTILRDRELVARGAEGYVFRRC